MSLLKTETKDPLGF